MTWQHATCARAAATVALAAVALTGLSAQKPATPDEVTAALTDAAHFTADELASIETGRVISKTETFPELLEASVVAAVKIRSQKDRTLAYFKTLISYVDGQITTGYGTFSRPPSEDDLKTLTIARSDVSDLRSCVPGDCALRLRAAAPGTAPPAVDWAAPDATAQASAWVRQQLVAYVADYRARGNAALVAFDDHSNPINLVDQWRAIADRSPIVARLAPALHRYATDYPDSTAPGANDDIYWDHQHYSALKPIIEVTQLITQTDPARPERTLLLQKQFYASHYLYGSLALTMLLEAPSAQGPTTYVVYINRARGSLLKAGQAQAQAGPRGGLSGALSELRAGLSSIGGTLQRRLGEQMIRSSAEQLLSSMKEALER